MCRAYGVLVVLTAAALATATVALGAFTATVSAPQAIATATLATATNVAATQVSCTKNNPPQIRITWTASTSTFASGYTILRSTTNGSGYAQIGTVNALTTTFTDPSTSLGYTTTYYYVVDTTYQAWSARSTQSQVTTLAKQCN